MALDFSCPDWVEKVQRGETPIADIPLDEERARMAVNVFNDLRLPDVPGQPKLREASGEWFRDIVRAAFASKDPETGEPAINEIFCLVPKKNSKTTNSAALGLTALIMSDIPNASMQILGPTQAVSSRCFSQAHGMIKADPELKKIFHVDEHEKVIRRIKTGATLAVKTFSMAVITGEIPALTIIDELHVIAQMSFADRVIAQITGGMITNHSALLVYITTQSDVVPSGVFKTKLEYARGVRDGIITDRVKMLPVIYEFPASMQEDEKKPWMDPATWPMVLPNLNRSVKVELLKDTFAKAMHEGPAAIVIWASQHLNIQIGLGLHADRWPGAMFWQSAALEPMTLEDMIELCDVCVVGIDGGGLDDLFAMVVIGRHSVTRTWMVWGHAWAQPEVLERRKEIAPRLQDFEKDGDLTICQYVTQDVEDAAAIIVMLDEAGKLPEENAVGCDPQGMTDLIDALEELEFDTEKRVGWVSQGFKLQRAVLSVPRRLKAKTCRHVAQPLMAWAIGNAKQELRGSNYYVTKQASGSAKIDPVMALLDAAMLMDLNPEPMRKKKHQLIIL